MRARVIDRIVPDGDPAVDYTVKDLMCGLAARDSSHPCIIALARRLKSGTGSDEEAVRRAFKHVVDTIPYRHDPATYELVVAPKYTLGCELPYDGYKPHGDCDCQSTALAAILMAMGYDPLIRVVAWRRWDFTHVNLIVQLPGSPPIPLDTVMKGRGFGRQKPPTYREKIYRCPMKVRALADGGLSDCGCSACRAKRQGLSDCGCKRKRKSCCPQSATNTDSPVTVNVNTGTQDSRRWIDASDRTAVDADASRWVQFPAHTTERQVVTREVPKTLRVSVPPAVVQPVIRQTRVKPIYLQPVRKPDTPQRTWKEFT